MCAKALYVDVAVPLPLFRTFTYEVPASLREVLQPGKRVRVPFRNRKMVGLAVKLHENPGPAEARPVEAVLDEEPLLGSALMELGRWVAAYYLAPPGEAFRVMLPPGLLSRPVKGARAPAGNRLWPARRRLAVVEVISSRRGSLTGRQKEVLGHLEGRSLPVPLGDLCRRAGCGPDLVRRLEAAGALRLEAVDLSRSPWERLSTFGGSNPVEKHPLTEDQRRVLERIEGLLETGGFGSLLVHGVTGSGKTEIYLNAMASALARGRSALLLVPEIGLTPQMSRSIRGWFGADVSILHSGLSDGERFDQWRRIWRGDSRVVVGTRSAVFAPLPSLGLVIVDEEHDGSYKQEEIPRYHARHTALKRGELEGALVVLGSATPQLETYYGYACQKRAGYEVLSTRILERPLPDVHIVDMRVEFEKRGREAVVSELLEQTIADRLGRGEQVLVLLNRRGYSLALLCRSCGYTEACRHCSISLTFHQELNRLSCHYCGYARSLPRNCTACGKEYLHFLGEGTERIQEILEGLFPGAVIDRLDRDAVQRRGSYERILGRFQEGRTDLLIGTQMIAKGHDFPRVTLVGVLSAEQALRLADFRAAERTFQLLTQVAGRAGRGDRPGEVVIQTYYPNHYVLKYACAQDYRRFFDQESAFRRNFRYPPYTILANLVMQGEEREPARKVAEEWAEMLLCRRNLFSSESRMRILGPAPAALERLKGRYRFQVLIKATSRRELQKVLRESLEEWLRKKHSLKKIAIDIDPINLL